ncbi:DnaD domain protein [Feifania hominis]|uniref:DnaD domain protein n=1 Tax=Feifania hominis TaxID=2763660 RepID=A0A926DF31_9FIRM|nr:DnaD domain protein [Feifania hominis]MBC8536682.1 DnaD domain protein [Feifania hominis]
MGIRFRFENRNNFFLVPNAVVDRHLGELTLGELRVLLYLLRNPACTEENELCRALSMSREEIGQQVCALVEREIFTLTDGVVTLNPLLPCQDAPTERKPARRSYTQRDIETAMERDPHLRGAFQEIQKKFDKPLSPTECEVLYSVMDYYGFSPELVYVLADYVVGEGRRSVRYLEKVAADWNDRGIRTLEAAEDYIEQQHARRSYEGMVKRVFGISGRNLTTREKNFIRQWKDEFGFGEEMILAAFETGVDRTGKMAFAYINKILASWHEKGYRTPDDCKKEKNPRRKGPPETEHSFDMDELEQWAFQVTYGSESEK